MWYFKTFMVDARPLKQTKAWLKLVLVSFTLNEAFPFGSEGKASAYNAGDSGSIGKIPWRGKWQPTPVLLPEESQGWRNLVGYSPCGCKEPDMTEKPHFHFHLEWTNKKKFIYNITNKGGVTRPNFSMLPWLPTEAEGKFCGFQSPLGLETFQVRVAQSNGLFPFRVCVPENRSFGPQESNSLPWCDFFTFFMYLLLHLTLLCSWVYLKFRKSKPGKELPGEILIFWGKFLGLFYALEFFLTGKGVTPFQAIRRASI